MVSSKKWASELIADERSEVGEVRERRLFMTCVGEGEGWWGKRFEGVFVFVNRPNG